MKPTLEPMKTNPKRPDRGRRPWAGLRRLSPALPALLAVAGGLTGCISTEDYNQIVAERNKWRTSALDLDTQYKHLRAVLDDWIKAHKVLEERVKRFSVTRRAAVVPRDTRREIGRLKKQVERYTREIAILEAKAQRLEEDRDAFQDWYKIYRRRYRQAVLREQRLQRKSKVYERMVKNLESDVEKGNLKLQEAQGRLTVSVLDKIVFAPGGLEISPEGRVVLKKLANLLKGLTGKRIQVEGHTDALPVRPMADRRYRDNWELSTLRASAVVRFLQEAGGVDPTLLSAVGHGPFQPVATNATPEGRRKNRRIEIVLTPLPKRTLTRTPSPDGAPAR